MQALDLLREHGIEIRPSLMPFTPWTTPRDVLEIVDFVVAHDLVANVDPVQYTIRLLVPEGSLLLERKDLREHLGPYEAERLSYPWRSADPAADRLQGRLSALVQQSAAAQEATGADVRAHPRGGTRGQRRAAQRSPSRRRSPSDRPRGGHGSPSRGSAERSPPRTSSVLSQRDHLVRRVARQRRVQIRWGWIRKSKASALPLWRGQRHLPSNGRLTDDVTFPARAAGIPLTFQVVVHTKLGSVTLDWSVKVQK